ncbi:TAXI family TRAP transporter solute-binding subunit [Paenisporosarcina antarctica]|uniref:TAXI family TRAP transporter solute-binding subunit n=1 Tax=Paenisporosarcina antarctica TaxID=417367 RepID=A0A4P6ZZI6_9BACL|nr:TAXI family TRAP transporter solute-binding subunit [Paenisporosarcina antarctica]QBP41678.1 TAXI family TRAP transporter solute-binding subunit [Paenisporosarcina antarctica]
MKKKQLGILAALGLSAALVLSACGSGSSSDSDGSSEKEEEYKFLSIVTGGTTGTYYALGGTLAQIIKTETGVDTTAEVSQASAANMTALKDGKAEIAFVQTDIAYYATAGEFMFEGDAIDSISAIGALYPETVQLVTISKTGITSYDDLRGKKVSVGAPGSGTFANAEQLLEIHGMTMDDIQAQNLDFGESQESIQSGQIDAAFITSGTPTGAVESLNALSEVVIVPVEDAKADELLEKYPYYAKETIPAGTYGMTEEVPTVSVLAMLAVSNELPEDLVYDITKAIYENTDKIMHPKGEFIKAETALDGIDIDVHPGAQKYFDEAGVGK